MYFQLVACSLRRPKAIIVIHNAVRLFIRTLIACLEASCFVIVIICDRVGLGYSTWERHFRFHFHSNTEAVMSYKAIRLCVVAP